MNNLITAFILLYILKDQVTFPEWLQLNIAFLYVVSRGIIIPSKSGYNRLANQSDPVYSEMFKLLNKKYGKIVKSNVYFQNMTFILDPELEQTILLYSPYYFGPGIFKKNIFKQFMNKNVGVAVDNDWKLTRRFNEHILDYKSKNPKNITSIIDFAISKHITTPPLNIHHFIHLANHIAFSITFGNIPYNKVVYTIIKESQSYLSLHGYNNINPTTRSTFEKLIKESLKYPNNIGLIQRVIKQKIIDPNKEINYELIRDQILHWIFPSRNIILFVIPIFLSLTLSDLNIYHKLKQEIIYNSYDYMINDKNTYLHFCLLETLRLYNIVITLLRTTRKSIKLRDINFEKGENLFMLFPYLLRSEKYVSNPHKFYPERFKLSKLPHNFPFSIGPQSCPGMDISLIILKTIVIHLFKYNYRLESDKIDLNNTPYGINVYKLKFSIV